MESPDPKITSEEATVKRVKSTYTETRAGNRQFVCNDNKFEAIAEQSHDNNIKRDRKFVRFDCDSDVSKSCGRCEEKSTKKQVGSENGFRRHERVQERPDPRFNFAEQFG